MKPILLCAIFFASLAAVAQPTIDEIFSTRFSASTPGCAVIISSHGKVIYRKAFGKADLELNVDMKPEHIFRIGSITKQFTAVAILQLVEKGVINLKDDITKFIPDYPSHGKVITIENLLSHTSGIKNFTEIENLKTGTQPYAPLDVISLFKDQPVDFEPGTQYHYSNSGYVVLGYIIERMSGLTYNEYLNKNIFSPLGMRQSFYDNSTKLIPDRTHGYVQMGDSAVNAEYLNTSTPYAAGALIMNVDDLLIWHQALINNKLLKEETLKMAQTPFTLKDGTKTTYGFGWDLADMYGSPSISHSGSITGYASIEIYLPKEDFFIAVLANKINVNVGDLARMSACLLTSNPMTKDIRLPAGLFEKSYVGKYKFKGGSTVIQPGCSKRTESILCRIADRQKRGKCTSRRT
ncbi:MAG: serine hydrolase domain-containing protein [Bacteroidota bacterium]